MAKCILLLAFFLPSLLGKCSVHKAEMYFKRAIYDFSVELTTRIAVETDSHFVTSPLSVWSIISAVSQGARGTTLDEIQKVLKHHPNRCLNKKYYEIAKILVNQNSDVTVERSGTIILNNALDVKQQFIRRIETNGISKVLAISYADMEQAAADINSLVSNVTHGRVDQVVDSDDLVNKPLLLLDTIYFKGNWRTPFMTSETEIAPFYDEDKQFIGDVNLMFVNDKFNRVRMDLVKAQVLELPYGNGRFSMLIFLPYEGIKLITVIDSLKVISVRSIYSLFESKPMESVMVQLPRFEIETELDNLVELLKDMGLESMFDAATASFPRITEVQLHVSGLKQKAAVVVDEDGTEALATSELEFQDRSLPPQVSIQRPFLFMIVEKAKEVVLFTGAYSKPSLF